jgi:hypothetical protein
MLQPAFLVTSLDRGDVSRMASLPEGEAEGSALEASLQSLLARAQALLDEIAIFESFLQTQQSEVDIWSFKRDLKGEKDSLEKSGRLISLETTVECVANRIDSSNISWYEALWAVAKRQRGVTALRRKIFRSSLHGDGLKLRPVPQKSSTSRKMNQLSGKQNVLVDIVANDGLEWIKVSTITQRRLLFELAKEGWNAQDSSSESDWDPANDGCSKSSIDLGDLKLVKVANNLKQAATGVRVRYQHPKIRFIMTNIAEGVIDEVDAVIAGIRAMGATVNCYGGSDYGAEEAFGINRLPREQDAGGRPLQVAATSPFHQMLPLASGPRLTSTLNIDCTILLSLISDISHVLKEDLQLAPAGRYCADVLRQIEVDAISPLLLNDLYPVLIGRDLVCTAEAARRMREIVETMGTHAEKTRADIIFGEGIMAGRSPEQLKSDLNGYTAHAVPKSLRLPLKVVDFDVDAVLTDSTLAKHLPVPIANNVVNTKLRLSVVNKSMFLYGWDAGIVTLTGNRVATSQIERAINAALDEAEMQSTTPGNSDGISREEATRTEFVTNRPGELRRIGLKDDTILGPEFCFSTPRSLIGKDKGKEGGIGHLNASRRAWEKWVTE